MLLLAWRHHVTGKIRYDTSACMLVHSLSNKPGAKKTVPLLAQRYVCLALRLKGWEIQYSASLGFGPPPGTNSNAQSRSGRLK